MITPLFKKLIGSEPVTHTGGNQPPRNPVTVIEQPNEESHHGYMMLVRNGKFERWEKIN